jgi:hypothetical protein
MELAEYPYKPKSMTAVVVMVFFAACAAVLAHEADTNDRGLIINRIIELSPSQATVFYWVLAGLSVLFVIGGLFMLVRSFAAPRRVSLTRDSLISPKAGFSKQVLTIPYASIRKLEVTKVQRQRFLMVYYDKHKISIPQSLLPNQAAFDELYNKLSKNCGHE